MGPSWTLRTSSVAVTLHQMEDIDTFPTSGESTTKAPKPPWFTADESPYISPDKPTLSSNWVTADGSHGTVLLSTYSDTFPRPPTQDLPGSRQMRPPEPCCLWPWTYPSLPRLLAWLGCPLPTQSGVGPAT
jgi:hypothetical protein